MKGIGASPGISIGKAHVIRKKAAVLTGVLLKDGDAVPGEVEKFKRAVGAAVSEIEALKAVAEAGNQEEGLEILETHIELLGDPQLEEDVVEKIKNGLRNAGDAVTETIEGIVSVFKNMQDEYMSARAADVEDIGSRILRHLNETGSVIQPSFPEGTILIAGDIAPSDTISLDISKVIGFATESGGRTSHAAIVAKSRGIPAVVGCGDELQSVKDNELVIVDGSEGIVLLNPDPAVLAEYTRRRDEQLEKSAFLKTLKDLPAVTTDGIVLHLSGNISKAGDLADVLGNGGEGVGLFRTELLFMGRDSFPSEAEQFEFYKQTALLSQNKPVILRTIDIGGDKQLSYFGLPREQNPFLGYRAIRICLDRKDLFIVQLKAILRAAVFGRFRIMFPMISNIQEIRRAKAILAEAVSILEEEGCDFAASVPIGIMIEIPSAALTADLLAKEVDFFSIGTNDLCQYTLAVDRMNEKIKDLYDPFNPGVLRLIRHTIEQGHRHHIHVGMCGEMASDPLAILLLIGMGLREFSMSAGSIPVIREIILKNSVARAEAICKKVMEMDNSEDIQNYLREEIL